MGNLLQTAWSIAFQLRNASAVGGASPALQVLTSGRSGMLVEVGSCWKLKTITCTNKIGCKQEIKGIPSENESNVSYLSNWEMVLLLSRAAASNFVHYHKTHLTQTPFCPSKKLEPLIRWTSSSPFFVAKSQRAKLLSLKVSILWNGSCVLRFNSQDRWDRSCWDRACLKQEDVDSMPGEAYLTPIAVGRFLDWKDVWNRFLFGVDG